MQIEEFAKPGHHQFFQTRPSYDNLPLQVCLNLREVRDDVKEGPRRLFKEPFDIIGPDLDPQIGGMVYEFVTHTGHDSTLHAGHKGGWVSGSLECKEVRGVNKGDV